MLFIASELLLTGSKGAGNDESPAAVGLQSYRTHSGSALSMQTRWFYVITELHRSVSRAAVNKVQLV